MGRVASRWGIAVFSGAVACGGLQSTPPRHGTAHVHMLAPLRLQPSATTVALQPEPLTADVAQERTVVVPEIIEPSAAQRPLDAIEQRYPLHGLALHMIAQVLSEPSSDAIVTGYFRRGGRLRVQPGVRGSGCDTRWHAVLGGGFVCAGRGFLIGKTPPELAALPGAPSLHEALPYDYTKITTSDVPLYYRAPSLEEERDLAKLLAAKKQPSAKPKPSSKAISSRAKQLDTKHAPAANKPALPEFVRMLMQPGFYISVDGHQDFDGRTLVRTVRGNLARAPGDSAVHASGLHGALVDSGKLAGLAFVYRAGMSSFVRDPMTGTLLRAEPLHAMEALPLTDEVLRDKRHEYRVTRDGRVVPIDALRIIPETPRPPFVPAEAHYLAVTLSTQTLVAYEGNTPVFATLVSTGKPEHETPAGIFRIQQKHISATMDGEQGTDEAYSIEDVPWTMYFSGSLALHAAFWHDHFGRTRSHGCVNLAPLDARWLFEWTAPNLPLGFHGVLATRENPGTFVVITP